MRRRRFVRYIVLPLVLTCCEIPDVEQESFIASDAEPYAGFDPSLCGAAGTAGAVPTLQVRVRNDAGDPVCSADVVAVGPLGEFPLAPTTDCVHVGALDAGAEFSIEVSHVGCETVIVTGVEPTRTACARAPETAMVAVSLPASCTSGDAGADARDD